MTRPVEEEKARLRQHFKRVLKELSPERRKEAALALEAFAKNLEPGIPTLSFASLPNEIDTHPLNQILQERGDLLLPCVKGSDLEVYWIKEWQEHHFTTSSWGFREPRPDVYPLFPLDKIERIFVPGLAFDKMHHRLGRGGGHYDRFLEKLDCPRWGLGFYEQLFEGSLPREAHDLVLHQVYLF